MPDAAIGFSIFGLPTVIPQGLNSGLSITVQPRNSGGSKIEDYSQTVEFETDDPAFPVPPPFTFTPLDSGSKTFVGGNIEWPTASVSSANTNEGSPQPVVIRVKESSNPTVVTAHAPVVVTPSRCPTCHSNIGEDSLTPDSRKRGAQGTDDDGNPVPVWTDDPLFTGNGFNGSAYADQRNPARKVHIKEIQEVRSDQEAASGVSPLTDFSDIDEEHHIIRRHIIELRESTEKILNVQGLTLEEYFKFDETGTAHDQNPNIEPDPQVEWVDVTRGGPYRKKDGTIATTFVLPDSTAQDSPTLPERIHIRAIHVEDLRHPIAAVTTPALMIPRFFKDIYKAQKALRASFKELEAC